MTQETTMPDTAPDQTRSDDPRRSELTDLDLTYSTGRTRQRHRACEIRTADVPELLAFIDKLAVR